MDTEQTKRELRAVINNAQVQMSVLTPRHRRYHFYQSVVKSAESSLEIIEMLEATLNESHKRLNEMMDQR